MQATLTLLSDNRLSIFDYLVWLALKGLNLVKTDIFAKHSILDVWQGSEYTSTSYPIFISDFPVTSRKHMESRGWYH